MTAPDDGADGREALAEDTGSDPGKSGAARLFDLRWLIAAMFVVYGLILVVVGIFDSEAELKKASGVRINLWTGIGMVLIGLVFAVWARLRPLVRSGAPDDGAERPAGEHH